MERHIAWLETKEKKLEENVLANYSIDRVRSHLEFLTTLTRRAGTEDELKAAKYIKGKLEEYGVDSEVYEFDAYIGHPGEAGLEILSPVQRSFPCLSRTFVPATPAAGVEGEVLFLGKGLEEDYRGVDATGKIVMVRPKGLEGRLETARVAQEKGALAQIHISSGKPQTISMGQIRFTWGNPTPETKDLVPKIPVLSISSEDGQSLSELIRRGRVAVRLKVDAWRGYRRVRLPVGFIEGAREPDKFVLFGSHYCSWFLGATDNAVGNSLMLEMARIFSEYRKHLGRGIRFAWWTGHEQGTYAGSTWYVDNFWDDIRDNAVAYLVLDGLGRAGSSGFEPSNTEEIRKFHERVIKDVLRLEAKSKSLERAGDQSFWGMGLPSFTGGTAFTPEQTAAMAGNWYGHAMEDTLDKVDMELAAIPFRVYAVCLMRLCNHPVLPFEFVTVAEAFEKGLTDLQGKTGSSPDLTSLMSQIEEMKKGARALNRHIATHLVTFERGRRTGNLRKKLHDANACLIGLSRILIPVLYSKAGRYGQDPMTARARLVPGLQALKRLIAETKGDEERRALETSLLRERNKLSDAFCLANRLLKEALTK